MKRILITLFAIAAMAGTLSAQAPKGFNYQLVVRNNAGLLVANHNVSVHLQIVQGSPTGTKVYELDDNYMTNANGLVTMVVGETRRAMPPSTGPTVPITSSARLTPTAAATTR